MIACSPLKRKQLALHRKMLPTVIHMTNNISLHRVLPFQLASLRFSTHQTRSDDAESRRQEESRKAAHDRWRQHMRAEQKRHARYARFRDNSTNQEKNDGYSSGGQEKWKKDMKKHDGSIKNYYEVLGVDESTSQQDIRNAYYAINKLLHPDARMHSKHTKLMGLDDKTADARLIEAQDAYHVLSSSTRRAEYDSELRQERMSKTQDTDVTQQDDISNVFEQNSVHRSVFSDPNSFIQSQYRRDMLFTQKYKQELELQRSESKEVKRRRQEYLDFDRWQAKMNHKRLKFTQNGTKGFGGQESVSKLYDKNIQLKVPIQSIKKENTHVSYDTRSNLKSTSTSDDNQNEYHFDRYGRLVRKSRAPTGHNQDNSQTTSNASNSQTSVKNDEKTSSETSANNIKNQTNVQNIEKVREQSDVFLHTPWFTAPKVEPMKTSNPNSNSNNSKNSMHSVGDEFEWDEMQGRAVPKLHAKSISKKHGQIRIKFDHRDSINFEPKDAPDPSKRVVAARRVSNNKSETSENNNNNHKFHDFDESWWRRHRKAEDAPLAIEGKVDDKIVKMMNEKNKKEFDEKDDNNSFGQKLSGAFDRFAANLDVQNDMNSNNWEDAGRGRVSQMNNNNNMNYGSNTFGMEAIQFDFGSNASGQQQYEKSASDIGWNIFVMHVVGIAGVATLVSKMKRKKRVGYFQIYKKDIICL